MNSFHLKYYHEPVFDYPDQTVLSSLMEDTIIPLEDTISLESIKSFPLLTKEQEFYLFRKLNYLKYLAFMAESPDEKDDNLCRVSHVRNIILQYNIKLVLVTISGYKDADLFGEAVVWMMQEIIDAYDYRMTHNTFGKFAADRLRKRTWTYLQKSKKLELPQGDLPTEVVDYRKPNKLKEIEESYEKLKIFIAGSVDEKTKNIIFLRLGLTQENRQHSFEEIAELYEVSYQSIQRKFDQTMIELFGKKIEIRRQHA